LHAEFFTPPLPNIEHKPAFENMHTIIKLLNVNATSVPTMSIGGHRDHLRNSMATQQCAQIAANPCVTPLDPGQIRPIPICVSTVAAHQLV
jgi:hypothetical protein